MAMTRIGSTAVVSAGGASLITFNNILPTFTDLLIVYSIRSSDAGVFQSGSIFANNYLDGTYKRMQLAGNGSTYGANSVAADAEVYIGPINCAGSTANVFSIGEIYIPNYAGSQQKSFNINATAGQNDSLGYSSATSYLWSQTTAITSLSLGVYGQTNNLVENSSATLYGITAGSDGTTTVS